MKPKSAAIETLQKNLESRIYKLLMLEQTLEDKRQLVRDCEEQIAETNKDILHLENAIEHLGQLPE